MHLAIKNLFQFDFAWVLIGGVVKLILIAVIEFILVPLDFLSSILLPNQLLGPY